MTSEDRSGTPAGTTRSPEYNDGLTVEETTNRSGSAGAPAEAVDRSVGDPASADEITHEQTSNVTGTLISADNVVGTAVYDSAGERLGTVDTIMVNKRSGQVAYAVMSFGGFLGIGERYHPLPWNALSYDQDKGGYNIRHTADALRKAPHYSRDEVDSLDYSRSGGAIDSYYGVNIGGASHGDAIGSTTGAGASGLFAN